MFIKGIVVKVDEGSFLNEKTGKQQPWANFTILDSEYPNSPLKVKLSSNSDYHFESIRDGLKMKIMQPVQMNISYQADGSGKHAFIYNHVSNQAEKKAA